jgi:hypothetical protein
MHSVSEESHFGHRCFALPMLANDSFPRQRYNFPDRTKPSTACRADVEPPASFRRKTDPGGGRTVEKRIDLKDNPDAR